jgi:RimJ/RimL family protein N-acetyltransferase
MGDVALRRLGPGDETALEQFLAPHWQTSMFLRANARAAGLVDRGQPLQGTYVAAFAGERIIAVAAQGWNGMILVQAPDAELLPLVVQAAATTAGRKVTGLSGPYQQVLATRTALGLDGARTTMSSREDLFTMPLSQLRLPPALADGTWLCRAPRPEERDRLADWRADYHVEALRVPPGPLIEAVRRAFHIDPVQRVLVVDGEIVAFATFNAQLPEVVQVGGVFTPQARRGRGYARAVVAGALRDARDRSVIHALLFTAEENEPARRAYLAIGFEIIGDYGIVLLG